MEKILEIHFLNIQENEKYKQLIEKVMVEAFKEEKLEKLNAYMNIILTNPETIKQTNNIYRSINKETDVLSFPIFNKEEIREIIDKGQAFLVTEALGDIIISIDRVKEQAQLYGHSFERELAYMVIHGFYHILGYDHITEEEKREMREKEENTLRKLDITRLSE